MTQETGEATNLPSDLVVAHRTLRDVTADGSVRALEINGDKPAHKMTVLFFRDGGSVVLGGIDMRQVFKPSPDEAGALRMVAIIKLLDGVDVEGVDDGNATALDRLHGAMVEYRELRRQARADSVAIRQFQQRTMTMQEKLAALSRMALRAMDADDGEHATGPRPHHEQVFDSVARLISCLRTWQQGAIALIDGGHLTAGGKPALSAPGALRTIVTSGEPMAFWSGLRETLAELHAQIEKLGRRTKAGELQRDVEAANRTIEGARAILAAAVEQTEGKALASLATAAVSEIATLRGAVDELQTIAERVGPAIGEGQIATQQRKAGDVARAVRVLVERYATLQEADDAALRERVAAEPAWDWIVGLVKQALGGEVEVRVHQPGIGTVRLIVPATLKPEDADAALELVRTHMPMGINARIELEPGKPPEGYKVEIGSAYSEHAGGGGTWGWEGEGMDGSAYETEAEAIDGAWEAHVESQDIEAEAAGTELVQDKADA